MNWVFFSLIAWIMLGFEQGLKSIFELGDTGIAPSFLAIYAVFIASSAPPRSAQWASLVLGAMVDLSSPIASTDANLFTVLGPNALGALLACQLVLALRGLMFRKNPLSLAFLTFVGSLTWQVVVTAIMTIRNFAGDPTLFVPSHELVTRIAASLYTGVMALPVSIALIIMIPLFAFQYVPYRFSTR